MTPGDAYRHGPFIQANHDQVSLWAWLLIGSLGLLWLCLERLDGSTIVLWVGLIVIVCLRRAPGAYTQAMRMKRLTNQTIEHMPLMDLIQRFEAHRDQLFLGNGFEWSVQHAQWAHEILGGGRLGETLDAGWLHGLDSHPGDLYLPIRDTQGHMLLVGTTGAGKTRTFDLLITQAVLRGEAVIIIDPKGDRDLESAAARAVEAKRSGDELIVFHPAHPETSVRLDPLRNFNRPSELSSRISGAIPSSQPSDPFKAFSQRALDQMIQGLLFLNERPTLRELRRILEGGPDRLALKVLEVHLREALGPAWKTRLPQGFRGRSTGQAVTFLASFYREQVAAQHPSLILEGVLSLFEHDRNHFGKMVAALLPVMTMLTSGPLESLLSPDVNDRDDLRPITDLGTLIRRGQVAYIGLDALSDGPIAAMIGSILLADLAAVAGDRYNEGATERPVNIFIDEASEVVNDACIQLLNKGRGAGIRMTLATQTLADFTARMGSEAKTLQILGNINSLIALRVQDADTQRYITRNLPTFRRRTIMRTLGNASNAQDPSNFTGNLGERLIEEESDRFPAALLGQLPDLQYLGKLSNGRIIKGRIPLIRTHDHA
jgi:conjugal transfer pilus assembly protein TraD